VELLIVKTEFSMRRFDGPRKYFYQSRFSRAILADQGMDMAALKRNGDVVQSTCPRIIFGDMLGSNYEIAHLAILRNSVSGRNRDSSQEVSLFRF